MRTRMITKSPWAPQRRTRTSRQKGVRAKVIYMPSPYLTPSLSVYGEGQGEVKGEDDVLDL